MDISRAVNAALLWGSKARVWPEVELGAGHPFDDHHDAGTGGAAHLGSCAEPIRAGGCAEQLAAAFERGAASAVGE
jgi:hypothetical protein